MRSNIELHLLVAGTLALPFAASCSHEPERPNVLLVSIDMLRADHVSCYGYARPTTPAIDRLAGEGVLFAEETSSSSWTLPGHASLLTSLADEMHGATRTDRALGPGVVTLAERYEEAGYETAGFYSGPYLHPAFGFAQGFDRYVNCTSYAKELDEEPSSKWSMDPHVMEESHSDVTSPRVLDRFTRWFRGRTKKPFFAFVHLWDAHFDFVPPPPYDVKFDPDYKGTQTGKGFFFDPKVSKDMDPRDLQHLIALYDGEIAWTDEHVGKLRALLEEAGVLENTIVVVTSDHGTEFFEHGLKGHRQTLYDEVLHVPLVMRWPAKLPARARVEEMTRSIDVGPTLLELCGLEWKGLTMGESLLPRVRGEKTRVPRAVCDLEFEVPGPHLRAVRTGKWKFLDVIGGSEPTYFDLAKDPKEQAPLHDLASELGRRTSQSYLSEVEALRAWGAAHPPTAVAPLVPADVHKALIDNGYVGGDDEPPPK